MKENNEPQYVIPARYRKMENLHIIFWLIKDLSWCMVWKVLGVAMIAPTMIIAIIIAITITITVSITIIIIISIRVSFD